VFEVRQGYKSKDSKRQNADIANAASALANAYLPCIIVLSSQIDSDLFSRYRASGMLLLRGSVSDTNPFTSTYAFTREVIGYDWASFFERNSEKLRQKVHDILTTLLSPNE